METRLGEFLDSSSTDVYKLPGEPAIIINGLPPITSSDTNLIPCALMNEQSQKPAGFGEWLVDREVQKLFGEQLFNGRVTQFDNEMGWYRVIYEDGDFEDLEWNELKELLVPLDVNIPLKSLAKKIVKKRQKSLQESAKSKARTRKNNVTTVEEKESGGS